MATIELRIDDFEDGVLPRVCASSGAPAQGLYSFRATRGAWWPLLLLLAGPIGVVAMLVVVAMMQGHVDGWLPLSDAARAAVRRSRLRALRRLTEASVLIAGLVALTAWQGWTNVMIGVIIGGALVIGYCIATVFRPAGSLGVAWARSGRTVTITDASDEFIAAYRAQDARRIRRRVDAVAELPT